MQTLSIDLDALQHAIRELLFYAKHGINQRADFGEAAEDLRYPDKKGKGPSKADAAAAKAGRPLAGFRAALDSEMDSLRDAAKTIDRLTVSPIDVPGMNANRWTHALRRATRKIFRYAATPRPELRNGIPSIPPQNVAKAAQRLMRCLDDLDAMPCQSRTEVGSDPKPEEKGSASNAEMPSDPAKSVETEARVAAFCADKPDGILADAIAATGLKKRQIQQAKAWKAHENDRIRQNPELSGKQLAKLLGCTPQKISDMPAWRERNIRATPKRKCRVSLDEAAEMVGKSAHNREDCKEKLLSLLSPGIASWFGKLDAEDWEQFLADVQDMPELFSQVNDDERGKLETFMTFAKAWKDEKTSRSPI